MFDKMAEVEVVEDPELEGKYGCVYRVSGEVDQNGNEIPDGWVEVIFSPFHRELFRTEHLAPYQTA